MFKFVFLIILLIGISSCKKHVNNSDRDYQLLVNRRGFQRFIDEEKLLSYLFSFGSDQRYEGSQRHTIYKRASNRVKKVKKTQSNLKTEEKMKAPQNVTITPKDVIKFELEDAKYNADYEQLRKTRKLRVRRSSDEAKNGTSENFRMEKFIDSNTFVQPKELLKFVYSDAVQASNSDKVKSEKKTKRETGTKDLASSDTRTIKITHPLSSSSRTKHVVYDDLPKKVQKIVESAIHDAVLKGKASDGDFLKFYYGDKIFKVPVSLSKYISSAKEVVTTKGLGDYGYKYEIPEPKHQEISTKYQSIFKQEKEPELSSDYYTSKYKTEVKAEESDSGNKDLKSYYLFSPSKDNTLESEPAILDVPQPTKSYYDNHIVHIPKAKEYERETIPITEDFNESITPPLAYHPTSYVEYDNVYAKKFVHPHEDKNYAFGYHVSDFKSGNNFGHTQTKINKEIKGEYSILLPDGRIQTTKYFADDSGFHADVSYKNIH